MRVRAIVVGGAVAGVLFAGCGSSSSSKGATATTAATTTTVSASTTTIDTVAAKAQITANWTKFFNGADSDQSGKLALLEHADKIGDAYKQAEAKAGASATQTTTKVSAVEFISASECNDALGESVTCAKVTYDLLVGGKPALTGQIGYAVLDAGVWKVSAVTDCALSHLGGVDCPSY